MRARPENRSRLRASVVSLGLLVAILSAAVIAQEQPTGAVDERERLVLPAPARNMVLAEMRLMLRSIQGVLAGLAKGDGTAAAHAARASGTAALSHAAHGLRHGLPNAFAELGMATHQGFDALADTLEQSSDQQAALAELAELTRNCVACHATYRIDEAP